MRNENKTKWIFIILVFIFVIGIINYTNKAIKNYKNTISDLKENVENLNGKINDLNLRFDDYTNEISTYQNRIESLKKSHQRLQDSYKIETEVPYEFIEHTKFKNDITDYRYVNLQNKTIIRSKVKVYGATRVIEFLYHISNRYEVYYTISLLSDKT